MKKIILFLIFISAIILTVNTGAQLADSPWPTYKGNSKHTGLSPYTTQIDEPKLKWKFDAGDGVETSPDRGRGVYSCTITDFLKRWDLRGTTSRQAAFLGDYGMIWLETKNE